MNWLPTVFLILEHGFTERQLQEEFTQATLARMFAYMTERSDIQREQSRAQKEIARLGNLRNKAKNIQPGTGHGTLKGALKSHGRGS